MRNNKFTNREEYLQYRTEWKEEYKQLSQQIRDYKFASWYQSLGEKRLSPEGDKRLEQIKKIYNSNFFYVYGLKTKAKSMLAELKLAKQEAQRQYLSEKESLILA